MYKNLKNISAILILSTILFSCFNDGSSLPGVGPQSPFDFLTSAKGLRIVNLAPNSPLVNFVVSTKELLIKSKFRSASAGYDIGTSSKNIDLVDYQTKKVLKSFSVTKDADKTLFFVLYDKFEYYTSAVFDNTPRTMNSDKSAVRFFLGTPSIASKVNLKVQNTTSSYSITDLEIGKVSDWIDLEPGSNSISVFPTLSNNIALSSKVGFEGGKIYTAFIGGFASAPDSQKLGIYFLTETDSRAQDLFFSKEGTSNYRFIQNCPGSTLDLMIDLNLKFVGYPYKRGSLIDQIKAGTRNIKFTTTNGSSVKYDGSFSFNFDKYYTIIATGTVAKPDALVIESPMQTVKAENCMIRIVHTSSSTPALKFYFSGSNNVKNSQTLNYKGATSYMTFPAGGIDVVITNAATKDTLTRGAFYLEGSKYYSGFVLAKSSGSTDFTVELIDDSNENVQDLFGQL